MRPSPSWRRVPGLAWGGPLPGPPAPAPGLGRCRPPPGSALRPRPAPRPKSNKKGVLFNSRGLNKTAFLVRFWAGPVALRPAAGPPGRVVSGPLRAFARCAAPAPVPRGASPGSALRLRPASRPKLNKKSVLCGPPPCRAWPFALRVAFAPLRATKLFFCSVLAWPGWGRPSVCRGGPPPPPRPPSRPALCARPLPRSRLVPGAPPGGSLLPYGATRRRFRSRSRRSRSTSAIA